MFPFRRKRASEPPDDGETPGDREHPEKDGEKSSKYGWSADQIELFEKLIVLALSAVEPVQKLVEVLMHMR
jgi:hypothetical protein